MGCVLYMGHPPPGFCCGLDLGHPPAGAFDCLFEDFFGFGGVEVGKTVVTTEGDEVEMT
jgi:hypothetical protein